MKSRARYVVALALIVVAQVFALLAPMTAYADGLDGPYIDKTFVNSLKSWDYRDALVSCYAQNAQASVLKLDELNKGSWFEANKAERLSYYTAASDGGMWNCNNQVSAHTKDILTAFGLTDLLATACSFGYTQINVSKTDNATHAPDEDTAFTNLYGAWKDGAWLRGGNPFGDAATVPAANCGKNTGGDANWVFFLSPGSNNTTVHAIADKLDAARKSTDNILTNDSLQYVAGWEALRMGCQLRTGSGDGLYEVTGPESGTTLSGDMVSVENKVHVTVVNVDNTLHYILFPVQSPKSSIDIGPKPGDEDKGWGVNFSSCDDLAKFINSKSSGYQQAIKVMIDNGTLGGAYSGEAQGEEGSTDAKPTCTVEGIGWIVCPVMNFMAQINDTLFGALSNMLSVPPSIFTANSGTDSYADLYAAWNAFRGYANILFIVAFLIIIYSQITSVGITNYGIKKLLPKLIIAAILVNASYYLCQVAVDLSNILGYGLKSLFVAIGGGITTTNDATNTNSWTYNIGAALAVVGAAGGLVALVLAISVPVVLSGLLALLMVVVILIVRRAIIILLIVVSPLAFVAWLLPNTEKWFKKWWDLFFSMLMLFPIISALFGAGALAGKILGSADFGDDAGVAKLAALGASVLPLIATMPLLQGALKATGALGSKLGNMSAAANKRLTGGLQKTGKERYDNSAFARGQALRKQGKDEYRTKRFAEAVSGAQTGTIDKLRHRAALGVMKGRTFTKRGEYAQDRMANAARAQQDKNEQAQIAEEALKFNSMQSSAILAQANNSKASDIERAAAIQHIMKNGSYDEKRSVLENSHTATGGHSRSAVASGYFSGGSNEFFGNGLGDKIKRGEKLDLDSEMRANFGNMNGGTLLKGAKSTADIKRVVAGSSATELANLATAVNQVETNDQLRAGLTGTVGTDFGAISAAVGAAAPPPPPPTPPPTTP